MFKKCFNTLVGKADEFTMAGRMFHAMSVFIGLTLFIKALFYQFTSLQLASTVCALALLLEIGFYYLSRVKRQSLLAAMLSSIKLTFMLILIYLYNGGLSGNMLLLSAISLFLVLLITPQKQGWIWLTAITTLVLVMITLEYLDPVVVQQHYSSRAERFIDMGMTYLTITLILYGGLTVLRKSYEQQKELAALQTSKLQGLNDEKDKVLSILSKELNAPMLSVKRYLHVAQSIDVNPGERLEMEKELNRTLDDAQYLLHNVLLWARTQMDVNHVVLEPVPVADLLKRVVGLFEPKALKKGIEITLDLAEEVAILADPKMLKVVLRNLISNAIKFTNLEGEIGISVTVAAGHCIIAVRDNGIGLTKEKQAVIFSLNIAPNYGTANEKGTGLGLVLCKDYVERQGGNIWFTSIPWEGTTFFVSLPLVALPVSVTPQESNEV
ncbi:signal transduction histidine kinase [Pedobacter sp. CAN_A7]|uniref:sensor histidine kinase n=1 Tax=Pedobacter sp. CAN_A7 TaxID=2787722 RepID=UPI0018C91610